MGPDKERLVQVQKKKQGPSGLWAASLGPPTTAQAVAHGLHAGVRGPVWETGQSGQLEPHPSPQSEDSQPAGWERGHVVGVACTALGARTMAAQGDLSFPDLFNSAS